MRCDTERRVTHFVSQFTRRRPQCVTRETTLLQNLGIDGDDAVDFFLEFGDQFGVDLSNLDLSRHFGPEGFSPRTFVCDLLRWLTRGRRPSADLTPITIGDLMNAVAHKRWRPL